KGEGIVQNAEGVAILYSSLLPLPLGEGWGEGSNNRLIRISIRRSPYRLLPDKSIRGND
ncbi:hypothetical protein MNBD_GAMMA08-757, partial [hydrothermal vent metagenome]